jgi:cell division protein FtsQ
MAKDSKSTLGSRFWLRAGLVLLALASTAIASRSMRRFVIDDARFLLQGSAEEFDDSPNFEMHGLQYSSRKRVAQVFANDFGRSLLQMPVDERRRRLLAIDWVAEASVARVWPNRVVVHIRERKPVAFVEVARAPESARVSRLALIDGEGVLLEQPPKAKFSFPVLTGVFEQQSEADRKLRVQRLQRLVADIGPMVKDVSEVDVSAPDLKVTVKVHGRALDLQIGSRNYQRRLQRFFQHYPEIRKRSASATLFDLRIDDRITAKE